MKFNEYVALDEKLKEEGTTINEVVFETTGEYLFEAKPDPESLDTKGDTAKRVLSPRFAKARRKITNNAKKFLEIASKNIVEKYLPKQLEQLKNMANKAAGMRADDRNPKEILKALSGELKKMQQIHDKSTLQLEDAIDKMEVNFEKRVKTIIDGSEKLSDKSKLKLNTYWTLVSTQVRQKLFNKIIEARSKSVEEIAQSNPELQQLMKNIARLPHTEALIEKIKKEAAEEKKKYTAGDGDGDGAKKTFEAGKKYKYTNKKGLEGEVEIVEIFDDGSVQMKQAGKGGKGWKIDKKAAAERIGEEVAA
jgi:hypothetical protein